jgi:hypothetical protein
LVSIYSSVKVDIFGSAGCKHRAKPCPKRVVELKLHRKSLTRVVCICTYSYNVSILYNFGFWRSACDIRGGMTMVMHSVMHSHTPVFMPLRSSRTSLGYCSFDAPSFMSGVHRCRMGVRSRCLDHRGLAIPIAKRSQRRAGE